MLHEIIFLGRAAGIRIRKREEDEKVPVHGTGGTIMAVKKPLTQSELNVRGLDEALDESHDGKVFFRIFV